MPKASGANRGARESEDMEDNCRAEGREEGLYHLYSSVCNSALPQAMATGLNVIWPFYFLALIQVRPYNKWGERGRGEMHEVYIIKVGDAAGNAVCCAKMQPKLGVLGRLGI